MPYTIIAHDQKDAGAPARRMEHREAHLALISQLKADGIAILGCPIFDDEGENMIGSMIVFNFKTRAELDAYLETEPYVAGEVWGDLQILRCEVAPAWQKGLAA